MQKSQFILLSLLIGFSSALSTPGGYAQNPIRLEKLTYVTPLEGEMQFSAPYGEIRSNHFHSGVDYKIGGVTGAPVRAVLDGYVARVVVRPDGFGKAVYINHANGRTSVYAHLDGFMDTLARVVRSKQYELGRFDLDLSFAPGQFPVIRQQVIGYGGNSGSSSGPHLHFEIREQKSEKPRNFFADGIFRPLDLIAPVLKGLEIYAVDTIKGMPISHFAVPIRTTAPQKLTASAKKNKQSSRKPVSAGLKPLPQSYGEIKDMDTISVPGVFYLGVQSEDIMSGTDQKRPVYRLRLLLDGASFFEWTRDGFDFSRTRYANAMEDYGTALRDGRNILRCYKNKSWEVDFVKVCKMEGVLRIKPGQVRKLNVRLEDESENKRDYTIFLKGSDQFVSYQLPQELLADTAWFALPAGASKEFKRSGYTISVPAKALYEGTIMKLTTGTQGNADGLDRLEVKTLDIPGSFAGTPWHSAARLSYQGNLLPAGWLGKITWVSVKPASGDTPEAVTAIKTEVNQGNPECLISVPGIYGLAVDTVAPTIVFKNVADHDSVAGKKYVEVEIRDQLSGISHYEALWDKVWVPAEYDPKSSLLMVPVQEFSGADKEGVLQINVRDRVGNFKNENISLKL